MKAPPREETALDLARYAAEHDLDPAPCLLLLSSCPEAVQAEDEPDDAPVPDHYYPH